MKKTETNKIDREKNIDREKKIDKNINRETRKNELLEIDTLVEEMVESSPNLKVGLLKSKWEKLVGKIATKSEPMYIQNGVLYIYVGHSVYNHHISMNKGGYIKIVNDFFGENLIKDISVLNKKVSENRESYLEKDIEKEIEKKTEKKVENEPKKEEKNEVENNSTPQKITLSDEELKKMFFIPQDKEVTREYLLNIYNLSKQEKAKEKLLLSQGAKKCKICGVFFEGEGEICYSCIEQKKDRGR